MSIELSQQMFRRLAQLYILSIVLATAAVVLEMIIWSDFDAAFQHLTLKYFEEPSDLQLFLLGGIGFAGAVAHVVAAFGLLRFRPWSRKVIWASLIPMLAFSFIPGLQVSWYGAWSMWLEFVGVALLGAMILLAYSRGLGETWFREKEAN